MKMSFLVFGLLTFGGCGAIFSADEAPVQKNPIVYTASTFDGMCYKSSVQLEAVKRTSGLDASTGTPLKGIGLVSASERGVAAMTKLFPDWEKEWELHCAKRQKIHDCWLYEISFVKQTTRVPDSPSERLNIWVLFDGTVVPIESFKNSGPLQK